MSSTAVNPAPALRHVLSHLLVPLLMCLGMGLAYLGALSNPHPHGVRVDIVGTGPRVQVMAQTLQDKAGDALDIRTVPTRAAAVDELRHREISGAYLPGTTAPELLLATAGSDTTATVVQGVFDQVAAAGHQPLTVTDVVEPGAHDPTSQAFFFLLVALSIGSYASVAVIGGAGAALPMWLRALVGLGTSLVVSLLGLFFAGPVFHIAGGHLAGVWALGWLYSLGIVWVGTGLHTFLRRWTTLSMTMLFVALNFTSSGGIFQPTLQPGFFGALHAFWNGAGFLEATRDLTYFPALGISGYVLRLVLWIAAGLLLLAGAYAFERSRAARQSQPRSPAATLPAPRTPVLPLPPQAALATGWTHASFHPNRPVEEELEENTPA
jgi:hypothetical protein